MKSLFKIANVHRVIILTIAVTAALVTFFQSTRATSLIDYSYQIENAFRIFQGEMPYRDFYLVLPPGLYIIMAALMFLTGGYNHLVQTIAICFVPFITVLLMYLIIRQYCDRWLSVFVTMPLAFTGQSIASYDTTAVLLLLGGYYFLIRIAKDTTYSGKTFIILGIMVMLPAMVKQNIGTVYWFSVGVVILLSGVLARHKNTLLHMFFYIVGGTITTGSFFLWLLANHAWSQFVYQVFTFPGSVRNPVNRLQFVQAQYIDVFFQYRFLFWSMLVYFILWWVMNELLQLVQKNSRGAMKRISYIPWHTYTLMVLIVLTLEQYIVTQDVMSVLVDSTILFWGGAVITYVVSTGFILFRLQSYDSILLSLLPIALAASAHAVFLSSGIYGSSYGVWPLLLLLLAASLRNLNVLITRFPWKLMIMIFVGYLMVILFMKSYEIKLSYPVTDLSGNSEVARAGNIYGLSTPGGYISRFEDLLSYVRVHIPIDDKVVFLPGDAPFFSATNRKNPLSFSQYHQATLPLNQEQIVKEIQLSGARWIIINRFIQIRWEAWPVSVDPIIDALGGDFSLAASIPGYDIYKHN